MPKKSFHLTAQESEIIRDYLQSHNYSQLALARELQITRSAITQLLSGQTGFTSERASQVYGVLGQPPELSFLVDISTQLLEVYDRQFKGDDSHWWALLKPRVSALCRQYKAETSSVTRAKMLDSIDAMLDLYISKK